MEAALGTFILSKPISQCNIWWIFNFWTWGYQSAFSMQMRGKGGM